MNEQLLREHLHGLVQDPPRMRHDAFDDVRRGRRSLRTRRAFAACATVVLVGAGAAVGGVGWPNSERSETAEVAGGSLSESGILQQCQDIGAKAFDAHWSEGARVLTYATSAGSGRAVLVSADGERWADCWLRNDDSTLAWVATYPMIAEQVTHNYREHDSGETGPRPGDFSLLERFPQDVARVSLRFDDGSVRDAATVRGFVVFQLSDLDPTADLESVHLYDHEGTLVAGPGMGPGDADLPPAYRTLVPQHPIATVGPADPH